MSTFGGHPDRLDDHEWMQQLIARLNRIADYAAPQPAPEDHQISGKRYRSKHDEEIVPEGIRCSICGEPLAGHSLWTHFRHRYS